MPKNTAALLGKYSPLPGEYFPSWNWNRRFNYSWPALMAFLERLSCQYLCAVFISSTSAYLSRWKPSRKSLWPFYRHCCRLHTIAL